jgi:GNAT superfamily N-acetyltransferase
MKADLSVRFVCALVVPRVAYARIQRDAGTPTYYFDSLFVREPFRRRGIGTRLLLHGIYLAGCYPELDIRKTSYVAQRIAMKAGFLKVGDSMRYIGCSLWQNLSECKLDTAQFDAATLKRYENCTKISHVYYLRT